MKSLFTILLLFCFLFCQAEPPKGYDYRAGNKKGVRFKSKGGERKVRRCKVVLFVILSVSITVIEIKENRK